MQERLVACDLFDPKQVKDSSGYAQVDKFQANLKSVGIDPDDVKVCTYHCFVR